MMPTHLGLSDAFLSDGAVEILAVMFALFCGFIFCGGILCRHLKTGKTPPKKRAKTDTASNVVQSSTRYPDEKLVEGITLLPYELQAKVFSSTGVDGLLKLSTGSTGLYNSLSGNSELWQHLLSDAGLPAASPDVSHDVSDIRDHYRVKSLGIDDDDAPWRSADASAGHSQEMMLEQAARVCGGLQLSDGTDRIAGCLASSLNLLRVYDVRSEPARERAKSLVDVIRRRGSWECQHDSLFHPHEVDDAMNALTESNELYDMLNAGEAVLYTEEMLQDTDLSSTESPEREEQSTDTCDVEAEGMDRLIDKLQEILAETKHYPMVAPSIESAEMFASPSYEEVLGYNAADLLVAGI